MLVAKASAGAVPWRHHQGPPCHPAGGNFPVGTIPGNKLGRAKVPLFTATNTRNSKAHSSAASVFPRPPRHRHQPCRSYHRRPALPCPACIPCWCTLGPLPHPRLHHRHHTPPHRAAALVTASAVAAPGAGREVAAWRRWLREARRRSVAPTTAAEAGSSSSSSRAAAGPRLTKGLHAVTAARGPAGCGSCGLREEMVVVACVEVNQSAH